MADVKQILVVDDHFEMLEFLRSMLQVSNKDHQVLAVPSAEEGLLEIRLTKFDLLITDVRLPGMSGFDLVRRARRMRPDIPVIMITAYASDQGVAEANELNVLRYFQKPLDTDSMLTAVHRALYGEPEAVVPAPVLLPPTVQVDITDEMERRLDALRADTGAFGLMLVAGGRLLYESGSHRDLHLDRIATIIQQKMTHSTVLAEELGSTDTAFNLLYQAGERYELYSVNIGTSYFVSLLFEASSRRGRIGTVWVFVQRAVKDLEKILPALPEISAAPPVAPVPTPPIETPAFQTPVSNAPPVATAVPTEPEPKAPVVEPIIPPEPEQPEPEPIELSEEEMAEFTGLFEEMELADAPVDLDAFWDSALHETEGINRRGISLAEAQKMGLVSLPDVPLPEQAESEAEVELELDETAVDGELDNLFESLTQANDAVDLDAFWNTALDEGEAKSLMRGISFEDAVKQGLLSDDFDASK